MYLSADIKIGDYKFTQPVSVSVNKSTRNIVGTATIELPLSGVLKNKERVTLDKIISRENTVVIKLGYDDNLTHEFTGYVTQKEAKKQTILIHCEDEAFQLRTPLKNKLFKDASLLDLLKYTGVAVREDIADIKIKSFLIKNATALQVIQKLKELYGIIAFFDSENKLWAGLPYSYKNSSIKYDLSLNIDESATDLEFKSADEIKYKIKAVSIQSDNSRLEVEVGDDDGEQRTLYFQGISSKSKLKELAESEIQRYKYTGYRGTLTGFGIPNTQAGDTAIIIDPVYPKREGRYYVESVILSFGQKGYRRKVELGIKL